MHELSIAVGVVETAVRSAAAHGAARVLKIHLRIGTLAGVEVDALSFCFPIAARGTTCEGAELDIVRVPAMGSCSACGATSDIAHPLDRCPSCAGWPLSITGGRELALESLEVD